LRPRATSSSKLLLMVLGAHFGTAAGRNATTAAASRELVSVLDHLLDTSMHDSYAIEPEEYMWAKLPGRCCYDINRPACNVCKYWGSPDDFCHQSRGHCSENCSPRNAEGAVDQFGDPLPPLPPLTYCEGAPPPLVDGNKVCVGESRHSAPCYDDLNTGKCTAFGMLTCQAHCWWSPGCALFVVYDVLDSGDNMDGSCVLCYDLHNSVETKNIRTRIYRYTQPEAALPPAPPSTPSPSPPPHPPPPPPPPQPSLVIPTSSDGLAACTFYAPYELVYEEEELTPARSAQPRVAQPGDSLAPSPPPPPPVNAMALARVHHTINSTACCARCADDATCQGFVFEEASKVCVVLPAQRSERLVPKHNLGMTSGFVRRFNRSEDSPPPSPPPAQCSVVSDQSFSGGRNAKIGQGWAPHGQLMSSAGLCCGACAEHPECAKFTFRFLPWSPGLGECTLFRSTAEPFAKEGEYLTAGTVFSRDVAQSFVLPPTPPHSDGVPRPSPPPGPPTFPFMARLRTSAAPSSAFDDGTEEEKEPITVGTGAVMSLLGAALVITLVVRWAICAPDASGSGKFAPVGRQQSGAKPGRARMTMTPAFDEHDEDVDCDGDSEGQEEEDEGYERRGRRRSGRGPIMLELVQRDEDELPSGMSRAQSRRKDQRTRQSHHCARASV